MPKKILIVEDEAQIVRLVRAYLEQAGFQVSPARDGEEGLLHFRFLDLVEAGVTDIRCYLAVGTPPQNIRAFLEVAREIESA